MYFGFDPSRLLKALIGNGDLDAMEPWQRALARPVRIGRAVVRDLSEGQLSLRATGLVYASLLSIVPMLAIGFSVLKGLGAEARIEPLLLSMLAPFGDHANEISDRILGFVQNVKASVLGTVGLVLLLYTASSLIQRIEIAFNAIWQVRRSRSLARRFSDYLSVLLVGPLLLTAAVGIAASLTNPEFVARTVDPALVPVAALIGKYVPVALVAAGFLFVYVFVPNTRVRFTAALAGAAVATVLGHALSTLFAVFVAQASSVTAIYSAFAALILFMIWLYLAWMVLLVGASVSFYFQNPDIAQFGRSDLRLSARFAEALTLHVAAAVASDFHHGKGPTESAQLAQRLHVPGEAVETVLDMLCRGEILTRAPADQSGEQTACLLLRPSEQIRVTELLDLIRSEGELRMLSPTRLPEATGVDRWLRRRDDAVQSALGDATLRDLALAAGDAPEDSEPSASRGSQRAG